MWTTQHLVGEMIFDNHIVSPSHFENTGYYDFSSSTITQTFQASDVGTRNCANIPFFGDTIYEGDEQFLVTFGNLPDPDAGVRVGLIYETTITILDDDG